MSTNFYLRNKKDYERSQKANTVIEQKINEIVKEIKSIIDNEDEVRKIQWKLEDYSYVGYEEIHIGLRSAGWKPSFERQEQFSTVRQLKEFYQNNKENYDIVDEYGKIYDWEGLENDLIKCNPEGRENNHDSYKNESYKDEDGYIWHRYEFS